MVAAGHMFRRDFMPTTMPRIVAAFPYRGTAIVVFVSWLSGTASPRFAVGDDDGAATAADGDEVFAGQQGDGPVCAMVGWTCWRAPSCSTASAPSGARP